MAASDKIAALARSQGRYQDALLQAHARTGPADDARLRTLQLTARRDRSEAEISLDRLSQEPPRPPMTTDLAEDLMGSAQRKAQTLLALHAALRHRDARSLVVHRSAAELSALGDLIVALEKATDDLVRSLHELTPPAPVVHLRELQLRFAGLTSDETLSAGTDALVDAHDSARDALDRSLQAHTGEGELHGDQAGQAEGPGHRPPAQPRPGG
jgi:hypothetical protein